MSSTVALVHSKLSRQYKYKLLARFFFKPLYELSDLVHITPSRHSLRNAFWGPMESIQLLNTAIIKSKEKVIDSSYEERLKKINNSPAIAAINDAITNHAKAQNISCDHAAIDLIEAVRELDSIWTDYVTMEGIDRLKGLLKGSETH